jgi:ferredoxin-thioredoxin reductase catalytic chain
MSEEHTAETEMLKWARSYAKKHRLTLNPNKKQLETVIRGLVRNKAKFGHQYCPCRIRSGDEEKDRAIVCPCVYHKAEIADDGSCHCKLYFKKAKTP